MQPPLLSYLIPRIKTWVTHDSIRGFIAGHRATDYEPGLDAEELGGVPCGAGALTGRLLPDLRIQAGSAFSLTAKPARFLASAACQAARDTITPSGRHPHTSFSDRTEKPGMR